MKKTIKLLSIMLSVVVLFSAFSIVASAGEPNFKNYKGYSYTKNGNHTNGVEIKNYTGTKKSITIPEKIKGVEVKHVVLGNKTKVKSAVLPKTAEFIRVSQAPNLKEISIKNNAKYKVKNNILLNKKGTVLHSVAGGLKTVTVPKKVKKIYHQAFVGSKVEKVVLGVNFEKIDTYAFYKCKKLEKVIINSKTKAPKIYDDAFEDVDKNVSFYVKNEKVAKTLKNRLNKNGPDDFKIYIGTKLYR